jgi:hypothetical protein
MRKVIVAPGSELDRALAEANGEPVVLERNGARYRLVPEKEDIFANYDPEEARRVLDEMAGSWSDVDAEKLIADIYRWREEGSRPIDRPRWPTSSTPTT